MAMFGRLWNALSTGGTVWGFLPSTWASYITAFGWTALMTAAGFFQHQPVMWIMAAIPVVLASFFTLFLRYGEWRERSNPVNKVLFIQPMVLRELNDANLNLPREFTAFQIGAMIKNDAKFPLSLILESAETQLDTPNGIVRPPRGQYPKPPRRLDPGEVVVCTDDIIRRTAPGGTRLMGHMNIKVRYGYAGREIHPLNIMGRIEIAAQPDGSIQVVLHRDLLPGGTLQM